MSLLGENHKRSGQFYTWLRYQREREDVIGDMARYVFWDGNAPKRSNNPDKWRAYCQSTAYAFIIRGFELAWNMYNNLQGETAT